MISDQRIAELMGWSANPAHVTGVLGGGPDDLPARVRAVAQAAAEAERVALGAPEPRQCTWTEDPDTSSWDTHCGGKHQIIDGWPSKNKMRFCCYCGGLDGQGDGQHQQDGGEGVGEKAHAGGSWLGW